MDASEAIRVVSAIGKALDDLSDVVRILAPGAPRPGELADVAAAAFDDPFIDARSVEAGSLAIAPLRPKIAPTTAPAAPS
jgi:hypothetical protein